MQGCLLEESSVTDVRILSATMPVKVEDSAVEDDLEQLAELSAIFATIKSPMSLEEVTFKWPALLYVTDQPLKEVSKRSLVDTIDAASVGTHMARAIVSREFNTEGKRVYGITTWPSYYRSRLSDALETTAKARDRFFATTPLSAHEVIPSSQPVHAFFDIDVPITQPLAMVEEEITARVRNFLNAFVAYLKFCAPDVTDVFTVAMNCHREGKYSCHVVLHLNGGDFMFVNAQHFHALYGDFYAALKCRRPELVLWNGLPFADENPYRRNGEMRLPFHNKFGRPEVKLVPGWTHGRSQAQLIEYYSLRREEKNAITPEEAFFYGTLTTYVAPATTVTYLLSHSRAANSGKRPLAMLPGDLASTAADPTRKPFDTYSFFAKLAETIVDMVVPEGYIQEPSLLCVFAPGIVIFANKTTYCEIKNDNHRSNHTFYVCNLPTKQFYQRCFDIDCRIFIRSRYQEAGLTMPSPPPPSTTASARGAIRFFPTALWGDIAAFLEHYKDQFDVFTKRARGASGESFAKHPRLNEALSRDVVLAETATTHEMTVEEMLAGLLGDITTLRSS